MEKSFAQKVTKNMPNKKCLIIYYTGTGNTKFLVSKVSLRLKNVGFDVSEYRINPLQIERLDLSSYDLIGISYPIYGFNVPSKVHKFFKKQKFNQGQRVFIFKNSGETYRENDSSSLVLRKIIKRQKASLTNEYHFMMPYNIHFRYEEKLIKEMLTMDDKLIDILVKEIVDEIPNIKKYTFRNNFINRLFRLTYIGGPINVRFYKVDKEKCIKCGVCIKGCQMKNISLNKKGNIKFGHHCLMCMYCTLNCPKDAIKMGLFNSWRVNKPYNLEQIEKMEPGEPVITSETTGFFKCYIKTYEEINKRHKELFNE